MKKTIVLTGGSKGMGRSTLLKFAENDFNIFTCSRKKTDLKLVEDEIKKVNPNTVFSSIEADLSQKEGCNKFVEFVNSNTNNIDVLVNKTKCTKKALNKIIKKGMGAYYSSGSRPNQTAQSWGKARLYSAISGGPASKSD